MRAAKTPSPHTTLNSTVFPVISISDPPLLVVTKVGVVEALEVAEPDTEEACELEVDFGDVDAETEVPPATDELPEFCDDAGLDEATEEEPGADDKCEDDVGAGAEGDTEAGVVDEVGGVVSLLELELEPPPAGTTTPPCTLPTDCDDGVPAALAL
jgi:hypothetical protein